METVPFSLPTDEKAVAAHVNATHELQRVTPAHWEAQFQLYVPRGWGLEGGVAQRMEGLHAPVPLAVFLPPARDGAALLAVTGYRMRMEVSLEDWLDHLLAQRALIAFGGRWLQTPCGECWDAGVVTGEGGERRFSRVTMFAHTGSAYLVTGDCRAEQWAQWQEAFLASNLSFTVEGLPAAGAGMLEPWKEWRSPAAPGLRTACPVTWLAEPAPARASVAVDFKLSDEAREKLLAYVRLRLTPAGQPCTADLLLRQAVERLQQAGFSSRLEDFTSLPASYVEKLPGYAGTWVAEAENGPAKVALRISVRRLKTRFAVVTTISPLQIEGPILWMRAKRAGEIILACCAEEN